MKYYKKFYPVLPTWYGSGFFEASAPLATIGIISSVWNFDLELVPAAKASILVI